MTTKTMSIRMDRETFEFLNQLTREQRSDLSKSVREMVTRGRVLGVERYKKGESSLGKAAELAGIPVGQMMTLLAEFGVESRARTTIIGKASQRSERRGEGLRRCQGRMLTWGQPPSAVSSEARLSKPGESYVLTGP